MIIEAANIYGVISARHCALHNSLIYVITPTPGGRQCYHPVSYMET